MDETDEVIDRRKEEAKLDTFWKESDELVINAPTGHKLKDIAKYEVEVSNTLAGESVFDVNVDKKVRFMWFVWMLPVGVDTWIDKEVG